MAAGISHELNQPLAALQTFADIASALLARGRHEDVADNLRMISELVDRTGRIVRQLKTFARKEAATPQPVGVASATSSNSAAAPGRPSKNTVRPRPIVRSRRSTPESVAAFTALSATCADTRSSPLACWSNRPR